jgi:hypothetical protein
MPVRKIPKSYTNVTGFISSDKLDDLIAYEGNLEFYCFKLILFNLNVLKCEEQPVKIDFTDMEGKKHSYTPDLLVTYRKDISPARLWKPLLAEVKPRRWIFKNWRMLHPKFRAARLYAKERGLEFAILTEHEIVKPYLGNALFLNNYRRFPINEADTNLLLDKLKAMGEADAETLLRAISEDRNRKGELLPSLWQLVANFQIKTNLEERLTMCSHLRSIELTHEDENDERIYQLYTGNGHRKRWQALRYYPPLGS